MRIILLGSLLLAACAPDGAGPKPPALGQNPKVTEHYYRTQTTKPWLAKLARSIRNGRVLTQDDPIDELMRKSPAQVVDHFMSRPDFEEMVLDFNLFFLGQKTNTIASNSTVNGKKIKRYVPSVYSHPAALTSARNLMEDGDYLALFNYEQPFYVRPVSAPSRFQGIGKPFLKGTNEEVREFQFKKIMDGLDALTKRAETEKDKLNGRDFCVDFNNLTPITVNFTLGLRGLRDTLLEWIVGCDAESSWRELRHVPGRLKRRWIKIYKMLVPRYTETNYIISNINDIQTLDKTKIPGLKDYRFLFNFQWWVDYQNSSTNFNRKRAEYILNRYFCDDLTPIAFVPPDRTVEGQHGSDPGCVACHYKLDPIAGFFRNIGVIGIDFSTFPALVFDDQARIPKKDYVKAWQASDQSERKWNVGYIRSAKQSTLNDYGESLQDLFRIIRGAPEVRSCLIQRMGEYFLGDGQMLDPGWLEYLTRRFNQEAKLNSSHAFKNTVKRLVLSRSFTQHDPRAEECYDFAPGIDPAGLPPCAVAHILKKNCVSCHGSTGASGGLDLAHWKNGQFPHLDRFGRQMDSDETIALILKRISTSDESIAMPKGRTMASHDRTQLFKWLQEQSKQEIEESPHEN